MSWGAVASIGGAVIGSMASGDAADSQSAAAARTDETNRYIYDDQKALQEPFRQGGLSAQNRLLQLMGLQPQPSGGGATQSAPQSYDDIRAQLISQYTTNTPAGVGDQIGAGDIHAPRGSSTVNEQGLEAAIRQRMAQQQPAQQAQQFDTTDPEFGSLMRNFSLEDFEKDPGYQFRMDEGMRGVEGSAAARGGLLSGAAMKAIQKYGQGFASNEFGNAYQRDSANKTNQYNRLAGIVNTGQGATNQVQNAAGQFAQNTASNNAALGNAQAAGYIGQANALTQGIGGALGSYQNNELMKMIRNPGAGGGGFGTGNAYGNQDLGGYY